MMIMREWDRRPADKNINTVEKNSRKKWQQNGERRREETGG